MELKSLDPYEILNPLFDKAKQSDEFEFCCSLLRIRGVETSGWDPLRETDQLTKQILSLIDAPIVNDLRYRLLLFLYCHLTEISDMYNIVGNVLRVIKGERYSINPFIAALHHGKKEAKYPTAKAERIKEWSNELNLNDISELFEAFLVKQVRNAFYHSDYILTNDSFNIKHGGPVLIGNVWQHKVPLDWLTPRLELGINTVLSVINITVEQIKSYEADKIVKGRFAPDGSYEDIQLTVHKGYGLVGFKSPPDESLRSAKS